MAWLKNGRLNGYSPIGMSPMMKQMILLALPVIGSSFMTMAYNFINMIFVGRLGSNAVAAVGSAGFFMNLSWGLSALITVGAGIRVSHAIGNGNPQLARSYVRSGILTIIGLALLYYLFLFFAGNALVSLIHLNNVEIEMAAVSFLMIVGLAIPFTFQNLFFTSVFIGSGDSKTPFRINATAFACNIILDYLFIFRAGMGINGAAISTIISQATGTLLFYFRLNNYETLKPIGTAFQSSLLKDLMRLGLSPTIQRVSFTFVAIGMARIISDWGPTAIAVQKVGIQVEAISYMTAAGFLAALSTISGQAFGAGDYRKQWQAFRSGILLALILGTITSAVLITFAGPLFSIFLSDAKSVAMGREYLIILGFSQLFMVMELIGTGAFFGWGKTNIPAITGITLTVMRIPMALVFIAFWQNALSSVWWSISISSMAKGTLLVVLYIVLFKSFIKRQNAS
ncbi:MAG TPA: MATE family efflux transporter [Prolixibacteraceae bacterium]|jgi:putative MATE family efflux protein|nr:MATE family efflux transporter [Prolixibacteraceae bacterium]